MSKIWQNSEVIIWTQNLLNSYENRLNRALIERKSDLEEQAKSLFLAPFVVVSHDTKSDPIFNYGNQTALNLWEISFLDLLKTPSRKTVKDTISEAERAKMLDTAKKKGYIDHYQGIRITSTGRLFKIENAIVWNITNAHGIYLGQAATFAEWQFL
ncbi:MEKHLA domain-containing protein [Chroococcus sp. FPU101]|uniref:MEKHLA domain-containing protein n=1 Tax=Chroococcus sp. FPU101 TaxID=1974212 RepID=UPI001A8E2DAF|nr:MEKHLA domain-containing protein [Chroococcus sp. FPU101]GFE67782.1 hypothetical protein CFPU101_03920 [Chroococcus sp. FPU101]